MRALLGVLTCLVFSACLNFDKLLSDCDAGLGLCAPDGGSTGGGGGATGGGGGAMGGGGAVPDCAPNTGATLQAPDGSIAFCFNGFAWENPLPHGVDLTTVWGPAPSDVWAAGVMGMLMHWDGLRWTSHQGQVRNEASQLATITSMASSVGSGPWLAGDGLRPHQLVDGGDWIPSALQSLSIATMAASPDGTRGPFAVTSAGAVFGPDWSLVAMPPPGAFSVQVVAVQNDGRCAYAEGSREDPARPARGWFCDGGLLWVTDAGQPGPLWVENGAFVTTISNGTDTTNVWVFEPDGGVRLRNRRSNDDDMRFFGAAFIPSRDAGFLVGQHLTVADTFGEGVPSPVNAGSGHPLRSVWAFADGGSWTVGDRGVLIREEAGGSWVQRSSGFGETLLGLWVDADGGVTSCGTNSVIISRDTGQKTQVQTGSAGSLRALHHLPSGQWMVASESGDIYEGNVVVHDDDGTHPLYGLLVSAGEGWAVGENDTILHRQLDGGWVSDRPAGSPVTQWWDVAQAGSRFLFVGNQGVLAAYETLDAGWTTYLQTTTPTFYGLWVEPGTSNAWVVGGGGGLFRFEQNGFVGPSQGPQDLFSDLYDVWGAAANDVWAVGEFGVALHYDGSNWTKIETGTRSKLERVRSRPLPGGGRELIIVGEFGAVLRKRY